MTITQLERAFEKCNKVLISLQKAVVKPTQDDLTHIDATIQRFEFSFELFWLLLKRILFLQGLEINFPKEVLRTGYRSQLINDETVWIKMLNDRNQTSHSYNHDLAEEIYHRIKTIYYPLLQKTYTELYHQFGATQTSTEH